MATIDNKVVTFKDLYGSNGHVSFSDVNLVSFGAKGYVKSNYSYTNTFSRYIFTKEVYDKRLKYLYYGYAFIPMSFETMCAYPTYSWPEDIAVYIDDTNTDYIMYSSLFPLYHSNNITVYSTPNNFSMEMGMQAGYQIDFRQIRNLNQIVYSSISSMSLRDNMVTDVWTEYKPIAKIDPSTGEAIKDPSSGKILYETDEEGNILYEEGESYYEQREADAPITID